MGFHVRCTAADLLQKLSRDPDELLGEPYALYIVALCTSIDDDAIEWLRTYEMAIDSITGPNAAFLMFYNDLRVSAPEWWPEELPHWARSEGPTVEIPLAASVLRKGSSAVDNVVRYRPEVYTAKDIFVRSTTYQSDALARMLGITNQLPCLLLTDDPASDDFSLISLQQPDESLLRELRELLGSYFSDPHSVGYFEALRTWHRLRSEQHQFLVEARRLSLEAQYGYGIRHPERYGPLLAGAERALRSGNPKECRRMLNRAAGGTQVDWRSVRTRTNQVATAVRLARTFRDRPEIADETAVMGDRQAANAIRTAQNLLGYSEDSTGGVRLWTEDLDAFVERELTLLFDSFCAALNIDATTQYRVVEPPWKRLEESANAMTPVLARHLATIRSMPRPQLTPHLEGLRRGKRRTLMARTVRSSMKVAVSTGPQVIDALVKAAQAIS